jgi:hypothetical protein
VLNIEIQKPAKTCFRNYAQLPKMPMKQVYFTVPCRMAPLATNLQKNAMDHATMLCCSNMSGIDKEKLLVTGKGTKPQCGLRELVQIVYQFYIMLTKISKKWLMSWEWNYKGN